MISHYVLAQTFAKRYAEHTLVENEGEGYLTDMLGAKVCAIGGS